MVAFLNTQQISHSTLEDTPAVPFESGLSLTPRIPPVRLMPQKEASLLSWAAEAPGTGQMLVALPTSPHSTEGCREPRNGSSTPSLQIRGGGWLLLPHGIWLWEHKSAILKM